MDHTATTTPDAPVIEEAFFADRMAFWGRFTRFITGGGIAIAVLLVLMALFLG
jgi:hypothetical protein